MLYQVKFTVKTKKEYNNTYPKLCVLNKSKLPVCCIQVKTSDPSQEDDTMQCFDNKERMDTLILNEQFSKVLNNTFPAVLKGLHDVPLTKVCRTNMCTIDDYCEDEVSTNT